MTTYRHGNWTVLGYAADPIPGNHAVVRDCAKTFGDAADSIEAAVGSLNGISYQHKSKAVDKIRNQAQRIAGELNKAHSRCRGAGQTLTTYASALEECQKDSLEALRQAEAASSDRCRAVRATNDIAETYNSSTDPQVRTDLQRSYYQEKAKVGSADGRLRVAKDTLEAAISRRNRAAATACTELEEIRSSSPLNDSFMDRLKEFLKKAHEYVAAIVRNVVRLARRMVVVGLAFLVLTSPRLLLAVAGVALLGWLLSISDRRDADNSYEGLAGLYVKGERRGREGELNSLDDVIQRRDDMDDDDGIRLEQIRCRDGQVRYILYIDGTGSGTGDYDESMTPAENATQYIGGRTATDDRITRLLRDRVRPPGAEIMVHGYSQGGLHALNLVDSGEFNVTQVVTAYAPDRLSPVNTNGAQILNLRDSGDTVSWIPGASGYQGDSFVGSSSGAEEDFFFGTHTSTAMQKEVARQFENSTDPTFDRHKQRISLFLGGITEATYD